MTMSIQQHPASIDAYVRHGWRLVPIPQGSKGPHSTGWNQLESTISSEHAVPTGYGIGLAHAYSGTMALDIDEWDDAAAMLSEHGINLPALYEAADAVIIDSGRAGHGKLLYAMPFGARLPSRRVNQGGRTIYELRCATMSGLTVQDVLPPSIHPQTHQPYRWAGRGHWSRLPTIPTELIELWQALLARDRASNRERIENSLEGELDANWDEIMGALHTIDPDCGREDWITAGMALHWAGTLAGREDNAFRLWDEWSMQGAKYPGERSMVTQWRSFSTEKDNSIRLGSLFHLARNNGWSRPQPDASELFSATHAPSKDTGSATEHSAPTSPEHIMNGLQPPPPDFPIELMPGVLRERSLEIATSVGCDPMVPAFAGLAAIAGATDARTRLTITGSGDDAFRVPPVLWLMTIGHPADKKTPGSAPMMRVLKTLEREDIERHARAMLEWEAREAFRDAQKNDIMDNASKGNHLLDPSSSPVDEVVREDPQPVDLRLLVSDITSQKLARVLSTRPYGVLCYLDEMRGWCDKMTDKFSGGEDRSTWTQSYEARDHTVDRVGGGTMRIENMSTSIYGNIQPRVFREAAQRLSADGLLQRFIPGVLNGKYTRKPNPVPSFLTHQAQYDQTVRIAYGLPPMNYTLSPEAFAVFDQFMDWYHATRIDERLLSVTDTSDAYLTAFGKLEGTCARLILLWHIIESPFNTEVSADVVERVVDFIRCFVVPSYRHVYQVMGGAAEDSFEVWLTNFVIQQSGLEDHLTLRDIRRSARRQLEKVSQWEADRMVMDTMYSLEQCRWVTLIENDAGRRRVVWAINPELSTIYRDYRVQVLRAKQRRWDERIRGIERAKGIRMERRLVKGYDPSTMD